MPQRILTAAQYADITDILDAAVPFSAPGMVALTNGVSYRAISYSISDAFTPQPAVFNLIAPRLETTGFGGAWYVADPGEWVGEPTLIVLLQSSDDGATGWADYTAPWATDTDYEQGARVSQGGQTYTSTQPHTSAPAFATDLANGLWRISASPASFDLEGYLPVDVLDGKYVRTLAYPVGMPEAAAASAPVLLRPSATHILHFDTSSVSKHFDKPVPVPAFGADLDNGGLWLQFKMYFSGAEGVGGIGLSMGNLANHHLGLTASNLQHVINNNLAVTPATDLPSLGPLDAGYYLVTGHLRRTVAGVIELRFWRNDLTSAITRNSTQDFADWNYNTIRHGARALSTSANFASYRAHDFAIGRGDPAAFHEWVYGGGRMRYPMDYDFSANGGECTMDYFDDATIRGPATWAAAQMLDEVGDINTVTTVANGGPEWSRLPEVLPGHMKSTGPSPSIPQLLVTPKHVFAGTPQSLQFAGGQGKIIENPLAAVPWAAGTSYAADARTTEGGVTYICTVPHVSSGSFAADAANWVSFTVVSLTHAGFAAGSMVAPDGSSSLGDISGTLTNGVFTCTMPGTITAVVNVGGIERTATANVYPAVTMPAVPRNATDYGGNGLVAAFEPYPTIGAGTSYANAAALSAAINGMPAGSTLIVEDLTDLASDLTISARDFGGAVVVARNLHGVHVGAIYPTGVRNLTIRGFRADGYIGNHSGSTAPSSGVGNLWLDHCYAAALSLKSYSATHSLRVTNFQTPNGATKALRWYNFRHLVILRAAFGETEGGIVEDTARLNGCDIYVLRKIFVGNNRLGRELAHADQIQAFGNGPSGTREGVFQDMVLIDEEPEPFTRTSDGLPDEMLPQGLFLSDGTWQGLHINNVAVAAGLKNNVAASASQWGNVIQNTFSARATTLSGGYPRSGFAKNNVVGTTEGVLPSANWGTEIGTVTAATPRATIYPQYDAYPTSWRRWANPGAGFESVGPAAFIGELEEKRSELGL